MLFSNKVYDTLKWIALIFLPAIAVFYLALAESWGLPYPTEVAATIGAIDVFLAALIGISAVKYNAVIKDRGDTIPTKPINAYDILMWIAQIFLPAAAAFYFSLAQVWDFFPDPEAVVATIMALDSLLGMMLGLSTAQFNKTIGAESLDIWMKSTKQL